MKRWIKHGVASIPNGDELTLSQRDQEFSIRLSGIQGELMNSRIHGSEDALAELGCAHINVNQKSHVLVGGLGMGFTLSKALASIGDTSTVTVAELIAEVVEWNKGPLGECASRPLADPRVEIHLGDVADLIRHRSKTFDAILLDVDNGPEGLTKTENDWLYSDAGLSAASNALRPNGMLAVWSAGQDKPFTRRLERAGFRVDARTVRARPGKGSRHVIFLAQRADTGT
jgi:spermidine synthase